MLLEVPDSYDWIMTEMSDMGEIDWFLTIGLKMAFSSMKNGDLWLAFVHDDRNNLTNDQCNLMTPSIMLVTS